MSPRRVIARIAKAYDDQIFFPRWWSIFCHAFYFNRKGLVRGVAQYAPKLGGVMLDFGCGSKPYARLFSVERHVGVDVRVSGHDHSTSKVDVFYDGKTLPFPDGYFDSVFSSEVFEHVPNLDQILGELSRVLKPGGLMLVTMPWCWDQHEVPYDFQRYTEWGLRRVLERHGFEILSHDKSSTYVETIAQLIGAYVYKHYLHRRFLSKFLQLFIAAPIYFFSAMLSKVLPNSGGLYLNHIVLARKSENRPA